MKTIVGITGGIATGKSLVSDFLRDMGYVVIDSDKISHDILQVGRFAYKKTVLSFGEGILNEDKSINRKLLAEMIFSDSMRRERLNDIMHPIVLKQIELEIAKISEGIIFVDIPLLYESKVENICDFVVCVYADRETQISRLMHRDRITRQYAELKINTQIDIELKIGLADFVIDNTVSVAITKKQVENLITKIEEKLKCQKQEVLM